MIVLLPPHMNLLFLHNPLLSGFGGRCGFATVSLISDQHHWELTNLDHTLASQPTLPFSWELSSLVPEKIRKNWAPQMQALPLVSHQ